MVEHWEHEEAIPDGYILDFARAIEKAVLFDEFSNLDNNQNVSYYKNERRAVREVRADVLASYQSKDESGGVNYGFIFRIQNHYFEKGTPWVELDKINNGVGFYRLI